LPKVVGKEPPPKTLALVLSGSFPAGASEEATGGGTVSDCWSGLVLADLALVPDPNEVVKAVDSLEANEVVEVGNEDDVEEEKAPKEDDVEEGKVGNEDDVEEGKVAKVEEEAEKEEV
jgi:hypothetical protein